MKVIPTTILSNWNHLVEGLSQSSKDFYSSIEESLKEKEADKIKVDRVKMSEGGLGSAKREYLQVRRGEHVFHICAAPFGNGFFVSWWLGHHDSGFIAWLSKLPFVGFIFKSLVRPITYYSLDTAYMFQSLVASTVEQVLNAELETKGMRVLTADAYKPTIRDVMSRG